MIIFCQGRKNLRGERNVWEAEFWNGAQAAHRRVMMKAAGYSDTDIRKKPHIGVPNSYMAGSPGISHLRQIAEAVKEGISGGRHSSRVWNSSYVRKHSKWCGKS